MVKDDFKDKCIFDDIKEFYDKNTGELYSYQDFEKSGLKEFEIISNRSRDLKLYEKNRLADDFIKLLFRVLEGNDDIKVIEEYVISNPVITYYSSLESFIKGICEDENKKKSVAEFTVNVITKNNTPELIKSALIILPLVKKEHIYELLSVYSIHNDYLFYVLNAYEHIGVSNAEFFEIAKKSKGYGRFFAVLHLKPVTYEIINWMVEEGSSNEVGVSQLVYINMLSLDLVEYMNNSVFSKEKVEKLSKSFSIMLSDYGLREVKDEEKFCKKILEEIDKYPAGIYSLYITISILYSVEADLIEYYKDKKINLQISFYNKYKDIIEMCKKICAKEEWNEIVEKEVTNIEIEPSVIITCAEKIGYKIKKKDFEVLFKRDYANVLLYKYAFSVGNKSIKTCAYNLAMKNLKIQELTSGPAEFTIDKLKYEDIEHICFFIMTKYMNYEEFQDEYRKFNMKAVKSPLIETRSQAVTNLEKFKGKFNQDEIDYIKNAASNEMISSIKRGLNSLIIDYSEKIKKVVSVEDFSDMVTHVKDIYLTCVKLEGNDVYDRTAIFNRLQENDMVYMVEGEDGIHDSNMILVTSDKGVVIGTLPLALQGIIKNMMDKGKYFYGKVEAISDDYEEITVSVIMSYKDVLDDISDTLMLLSNENNEFIQ